MLVLRKTIPVIGDDRHGEKVAPLCSPRDDRNGPALCINTVEEKLQPGLRGFLEFAKGRSVAPVNTKDLDRTKNTPP